MVWSWDAVQWNMIAAMSGLLLLCIIAMVHLAIKQKNLRKRVLLFIALIIAFPLSMALLAAYGPWEVLAEGVYARAEYDNLLGRTSHGARYEVPYMTIFFEDGRFYRLQTPQVMAHPKGTHIRILTKNGLYKIEKATP